MTKRKIHYIINSSSLFLKFIDGLIILNVLSIILASYNGIYVTCNIFLEYFEFLSVIIFSIEYLLRLWTADLQYNYGSKLSKRLKFTTSKYGLIDLIAILPFYLPFIFSIDLRVLRILRLFRLLRILKLRRLSKSLKTISSVLKETKDELSTTMFVAFILLIISSTLIYFIENEVQPQKFENIGQSFWWSVGAFTTVENSDVYPITGIGKFLRTVIALIGIGFVALPTGIISSAFIEKVQKEKFQNEIHECPNCGTHYNKSKNQS